MTARLIDGKAQAAALRLRIAEAAAELARAAGRAPGLAVVLVGDDPASHVYVRNKGLAAAEVGFASREIRLPAETAEADLIAEVEALNADPGVDGVLVQMPLPPRIDPHRVIAAIDPAKDVDGFHPMNAGRLFSGLSGETAGLVACTPLGCMRLIRSVRPQLGGARAVVIGRSNIVGKPMAQLLLQADCTVTIAHSRTDALPDLCRQADVLVAAVGRPQMVRGGWVKHGAIVIDVGMNRIAGEAGTSRLVGDVMAAEMTHAEAVTPVPGGVGPMTIACLLRNTLLAASLATGRAPPPI